MISPSYLDEGCQYPDHDTVCIFTDGSIDKDKGSSCGSAVIGLLVTEDDGSMTLRNIKSYSKYYANGTNNVGELSAILLGLEKAFSMYQSTDKHTYNFLIFSDSEYAIKALTEWVFGWYKSYTYQRQNGIVIPSMMTKGGTPVQNAQFICAIIHFIVAHKKDFLLLEFINVKGHKDFKKHKDLLDQIEYYEKTNQTQLTLKEAKFISLFNHISDRIAYNVCNHLADTGYDINFEEDGTPCMRFNTKGIDFIVYDSENDDKRMSEYYILNKAIMKEYREILDAVPF